MKFEQILLSIFIYAFVPQLYSQFLTVDDTIKTNIIVSHFSANSNATFPYILISSNHHTSEISINENILIRSSMEAHTQKTRTQNTLNTQVLSISNIFIRC